MCQFTCCKRSRIVWFVLGFVLNDLAFLALALVGPSDVRPLTQMATACSPSNAMCSFLVLSQMTVGGEIFVTLFAFEFFARVTLGMLPHWFFTDEFFGTAPVCTGVKSSLCIRIRIRIFCRSDFGYAATLIFYWRIFWYSPCMYRGKVQSLYVDVYVLAVPLDTDTLYHKCHKHAST